VYIIYIKQGDRTMELITRLVEAGGKEWTGGTNHRVYFKPQHILGLEVECYKTGSLRNVTLNGERISNSKAGRIINAFLYVNVITGEVVTTLDAEWAKMAREVIAAL
jgi:hypothetical protein